MTARLRVAIIGCGIGQSHILEGYLPNADKFEVKALCDLDAARMAPLAEKFGIERQTSRFEDVLEMDDVDVIDICTPPGAHYQMILSALAAGKHVVCEKPLVGSLEQVDAVMAAERNARGLLMPVFQYRFGDGIEQVKTIIDAGLAGKPFVGTVETFWRREAPYYQVPWRGKWKTELGGVLMAHAIHPHDLFTYLMGDITRLFGRVATRIHDIEVEDTASASIELESGALGSFTATLGAAEEFTRLHLVFDNVTFESDLAPYNPGHKPWKILPRSDATKTAIEGLLADWTHVPPRFTTQMARFYEAIHGLRPLPVTSADSRRALEIVTAFYHSSDTGTEVHLPIGADHPRYKSWVPARFATNNQE